MIEKRYFKGEAILGVIRDMCEFDAHFRTFNADTLTHKIAALPVEDVRHVIRGEWKKDGDVVVCSNCGEEHGWRVAWSNHSLPRMVTLWSLFSRRSRPERMRVSPCCRKKSSRSTSSARGFCS